MCERLKGRCITADDFLDQLIARPHFELAGEQIVGKPVAIALLKYEILLAEGQNLGRCEQLFLLLGLQVGDGHKQTQAFAKWILGHDGGP